ncbi:Major facilitator superfamily domain, general substrate transporter [Akanthomyces lecanii RCEF 1005]|uniref:Major facilitator superfamily domain, general substrate transporter n=1 Tax=Akanthomyces lecanii RCEF 1005 TaxID=1081108 RepID=A0A168JK75_CORDF|nr:Major facilitator superfamily domain, general substrate transporter [Akanthomyces lecanii RCEF 1005]
MSKSHQTTTSSEKDSQSPVYDEESGKAVDEFPDGGLQAWLVAVGAFFGLFCTFGWANCVGVFQAYYETHQLKSYSPSTVAWISSLNMGMLFISAPFIGNLFDRFGPRVLLLVGTVLHVFGLMMASLSSEYYQLILSQAICSPIGAGMVLYPSFSCVATWFRSRRALALGITASGSSLGGTVMPIMVSHLMEKIGFGWTMRATAFVMLGLLIITNLTVKSRLTPQAKDASLLDFFRAFKDPAFCLTALASFFYSVGMFVPITFMVTYGLHVGMSTSLASYLVSIFNAASGVGRILSGYVADRTGNFNVSIIAACLSTIFTLCLWLPGQNRPTAIAFSALFGFSSGTYTALTPALVAQITDIHDIGTRSGTIYAFVSIAGLVGSPIGGALITNAGGSYWKLQIFAGIMLGLGALFFVGCKLHLAKWRLFTKV